MIKIVCVVRTEHMTNYTLGQSYAMRTSSGISYPDWKHESAYIMGDNGEEEFWIASDLPRYFKSLRDYNLQTLVNKD